jgi:translation initiation factor 2B subunit (eIF-2B alpha/beta/delta family)
MTAKKSQQTAEEIAGSGVQEFVDRVTDIGERVQSDFDDMSRQVRSSLKKANVNEATVPDAFRNVPKIISPQVHRWLDVAVTSYFAVLGTIFAKRGNGRAATAAFVNAAMVGGVSAFTDYNGSGKKPISFKMHGTLDALQASTAALAPVLHRFTDEAKSAFFYGQAANEAAVIAFTDWDAGMPARKRRKAA